MAGEGRSDTAGQIQRARDSVRGGVGEGVNQRRWARDSTGKTQWVRDGGRGQARYGGRETACERVREKVRAGERRSVRGGEGEGEEEEEGQSRR